MSMAWLASSLSAATRSRSWRAASSSRGGGTRWGEGRVPPPAGRGVIASTRSDMVSAVTGAIGALKGPLHGGAPGPVLDMLKDIRFADRAEGWVRNELAAGRRIMGFGHRVYKVRDPRAEVLGTVADQMGGAVLHDKQLFDLAREVERTVLRVLDEVKPGRNLKTNVEFYTALVLQSLGLNPSTL